jgi:hypothetical protein
VKTVILADCPDGAIVRVGGKDGRWGVKCSTHVVDFWDGGRERVHGWTVVEVRES